MIRPVILVLLAVAGVVLLVGSASAVTPKPRPLPTIPPVTPVSQPVVSQS